MPGTMGSKGVKYRFVDLPRVDREFFDEGRIRIEERFKTSDTSGDEWRFSCAVELYRKGILLAHRGVLSSMSIAATQLQWGLQVGPGELECWDGWTVVKNEQGHYSDDGLCCQPGCAEAGVHVRVLRRIYFSGNTVSVANEAKKNWDRLAARRFCNRHRLRGDGDLDDAESNYTDG